MAHCEHGWGTASTRLHAAAGEKSLHIDSFFPRNAPPRSKSLISLLVKRPASHLSDRRVADSRASLAWRPPSVCLVTVLCCVAK